MPGKSQRSFLVMLAVSVDVILEWRAWNLHNVLSHQCPDALHGFLIDHRIKLYYESFAFYVAQVVSSMFWIAFTMDEL
jgi:hypothetical protein